MGKGLIAPHFLLHNLSLPFSREVSLMGERCSTLDGRQRSHGLRTHNVDTNINMSTQMPIRGDLRICSSD
eukprot:scaffold23412_cov67-Skeletonema_dohrnii-CCMP3373.AAC.1